MLAPARIQAHADSNKINQRRLSRIHMVAIITDSQQGDEAERSINVDQFFCGGGGGGGEKPYVKSIM